LLAKKVRFIDNKTQRSQFASLERHMMSGNEIIRKPQVASARDDCASGPMEHLLPSPLMPDGPQSSIDSHWREFAGAQPP
jgi:hypothetical protein